MDELQLKDLQNIEAGGSQWWRCGGTRKDIPAVEVKQKATPARRDEPTVPKSPAKGRVSSAPIVLVVVECGETGVTWTTAT